MTDIWVFRFLITYVFLCTFCGALPWGFLFGNVEDIKTQGGRIPVLDKFLRDNAVALADSTQHSKLVTDAVILASSAGGIDPESTGYYIELLKKIEKDGLNALKLERQIVNRKVAKVIIDAVSNEELNYVMKQRHILDAFVDAAADVAWPWIRGEAKPTKTQEL